MFKYSPRLMHIAYQSLLGGKHCDIEVNVLKRGGEGERNDA